MTKNNDAACRGYLGCPHNLGVGQAGQKCVIFFLQRQHVAEKIAGCEIPDTAIQVLLAASHLAPQNPSEVTHCHDVSIVDHSALFAPLLRHYQKVSLSKKPAPHIDRAGKGKPLTEKRTGAQDKPIAAGLQGRPCKTKTPDHNGSIDSFNQTRQENRDFLIV